MAVSGGFPKELDDQLYSSRLVKNYLEYVKEFHPSVDIDSVMSFSGMAVHEVEDPGHWFSQSQINRMHEILVNQTGNADISREVGRYAASSKAPGTLRQYALGFMTPSVAYWMVEKFSSRLTRAHTFQSRRLGRNKIEISVTPKPGVFEKPHQCQNRLGYLEALAKLFTNRFAEVEHPSCLHSGADTGRYIITWVKSNSLIWKWVRNCFLLSSGVLLFFLYFLLTTTLWTFVVIALSCAGLAISLYSGHIEKKELVGTIQSQGDAAKELLDEMNIRYNNALLVQEIGQATSKILDTEELIKTIVHVMEKRLDFDRGMIMLANREKSRLIYADGYGYSEPQEKLLLGAEFHLDNLKSRGVFLRAFREQKPFLINDISKNEKSLSRRSFELAKRMSVQSLICVPIIYEKESLGIVAVDNVKSKRPLNQSDINFLVGVASQTAVNIIESRSFQKLQESEKKYRDLVENANSIILRMNTKGYITFFNEFAQRFFDYSEEEILGLNIVGTLLPSTEETKREIAELVNTLKMEPEKAVANQREYRLKNGEKVWLAWTNKPIFGSEGEIKEILSIGNDVTAVRRAAEEKKVLESQLQGAQKMEAIGTLAGGIAHDFNNILQAIIGYTQILLMAKESSDPDYEKLQAIEASAQRASELTQRLLVFGRKVESKLKPVDLNQEVHQVCRMLERTIPKMIEITLDLKRDLQIINCDPVQIEQIMMNLGVNARDAMPDGGKLVFQTRNVTLDEAFCKVNLGCKPGFYVLLRVSDSGIGMEKELQDHIFEPFFTTKETGKGTGLGLAMVYGIVKSHGGYITCDSQPNQGTVFSIYFPAIQSHEKPNPMKAREMPVKGGSERILIVDDEQAIRDLGVELLGSAGYTVVTAPDGETALELYGGEDGKVDLVILDLNMPGMGGKKCLEKLLRINSGVKVIVASGYSAAGLSDDSIRMGAKGFIGKPYEMDKLLKLVREVLDRHN